MSKPITPGDTLRHGAKSLQYRAQKMRRDAELLLAQATAVEAAISDLETDARQFDKYQPAAADLPEGTET